MVVKHAGTQSTINEYTWACTAYNGTFWLSVRRTANALKWLHKCTGMPESSLLASHILAHWMSVCTDHILVLVTSEKECHMQHCIVTHKKIKFPIYRIPLSQKCPVTYKELKVPLIYIHMLWVMTWDSSTSFRPPRIIVSSKSVLHLALQAFCTHRQRRVSLVSFCFLYLKPSYNNPGFPRFVVEDSILVLKH